MAKEVLLVTTRNEDEWKDSIYAMGIGKGAARVKISAQYQNEFTQMRVHNNSLYGIYGMHVYDILNNRQAAEIGGYRSPCLESLASHKGEIYCGDDGQCGDAFFGSSWSTAATIHNAKTKKEACCKRAVAMASHNGKLYGAGLGWIFDVLAGKNVLAHKGWERDPAGIRWEDPGFSMKFMPNWTSVERIVSLASHKEGLYYGCKRHSKEAKGIYETFSKEKIAERNGDVSSLVSYRGNLLDGSGNGIYNTLKDREGKNPLLEFDGRIKDMVCVPADIWDALVEKGRAEVRKGRIVMEEE